MPLAGPATCLSAAAPRLAPPQREAEKPFGAETDSGRLFLIFPADPAYKGIMNLTAIVLAAGYGSRMASRLPKSLHPVAGQPMLARILKAIGRAAGSSGSAQSNLKINQIRVVAGPGSRLLSSVAEALGARVFQQSDSKRGTAQAVLAARPEELKGGVLIINGDHPLIKGRDIAGFAASYYKDGADFAAASFKKQRPHEYGRLVFDGDQLTNIVEAYEGQSEGEGSDRVNAGMYLVRAELLAEHLRQIKKNQKGECNLTSLVPILHQGGCKIRAINVSRGAAFGVNSQRELSIASAALFEEKRRELMSNGVIILDPKNTYIESDVEAGAGTMIYPGGYLRGKTKIGSFCAIESNSFLFDAVIGNYVHVKAGSYIEASAVGEKSVIGPYAHLRPGTIIGKECRIGNFVETKKTRMGDKSKAAHLSYLGDAEIGKEVNIGCGTVTCNYGPDKKKRKTKIKDGVFVGSGAQLIAPLTAGRGAVIGAGSALAGDIPEGSLALERSERKIIEGYRKKLSQKTGK